MQFGSNAYSFPPDEYFIHPNEYFIRGEKCFELMLMEKYEF